MSADDAEETKRLINSIAFGAVAKSAQDLRAQVSAAGVSGRSALIAHARSQIDSAAVSYAVVLQGETDEAKVEELLVQICGRFVAVFKMMRAQG